MKKLKVLVIGGGGYIGSKLIMELINNEFNVRCFDRFSSSETLSKLNKNIEIVIGDIRNIESKNFFEIDTVIDLAALTKDLDGKENEIIEINKNARKKIIEISKTNGVSHYIRISSSNVYAGNKSENSEKVIPNPQTLYAKINLELDNHAIALNTKKFTVTVLRLASIFGDSLRMRWDQSINNMVKELCNNGKIEVRSKNSQRPFLHIDDVIRAIILVIESKENAAGEIFNVGSNDLNYSIGDIAKEITNIAKKENSLIVSDEKDKNSFIMNCDKINKKLGFKKNNDLKFGIKELLRKLDYK
ncbi:SDR family oxidoreductase [Nitrosopumilus sp.]|nr:SDR family oxidoreductase [Nitrosopumilus sp.]